MSVDLQLWFLLCCSRLGTHCFWHALCLIWFAGTFWDVQYDVDLPVVSWLVVSACVAAAAAAAAAAGVTRSAGFW
jgi:hypothetical protein